MKRKPIKPIFSLTQIALGLFLAFSFVACSKGNAPVLSKSAVIGISTQIPDDTAIIRQIAPYKAKLQAEISQVIGESAVDMPKQKTGEYALGNWMADVYLEEAKTKFPKAQIGLVASGGIRAGIQTGPFTIGNAFEIMPFENELVVLAIKGSVLSEIVAEHNKSKKLNFSGILVSLKSANSTISLDGIITHPDSTYYLATSDYLANGGDNLTMLKKRTEIFYTKIKVRTAIIEHIQKLSETKKKINTPTINRISFL